MGISRDRDTPIRDNWKCIGMASPTETPPLATAGRRCLRLLELDSADFDATLK